MQRKRLSSKDIVEILKEAELGPSVKELCRKHGISRQTFYNWRNKYERMEISDAIKYKALEKENRKLKRLVAELNFDYHVLKDILKNKQVLTTKDKKAIFTKLDFCIGRSRRILNFNHLAGQYATKSPGDFELEETEAKKHPTTESVGQSADAPAY
jgi:putative transposase